MMRYITAPEAFAIAFDALEKPQGFEEIMNIIEEHASKGQTLISFPKEKKEYLEVLKCKKVLEKLGYWVCENNWQVRIEFNQKQYKRV